MSSGWGAVGAAWSGRQRTPLRRAAPHDARHALLLSPARNTARSWLCHELPFTHRRHDHVRRGGFDVLPWR